MSQAKARKMRRGLKNRHLQMIALGGAIGTGLFYGSASTIALAGPSVMLALPTVFVSGTPAETPACGVGAPATAKTTQPLMVSSGT